MPADPYGRRRDRTGPGRRAGLGRASRGWAGTGPGARGPRPGRRRDRRRRAGCRTSCAGSGARRPRRTGPGWPVRPARSGSPRRRRPGRPPRAPRRTPRSTVVLEHAVGGRVGQHDRGDRALVRGQLGPQVAEVDGAVGAALDHDHAQPGEHRAGRVGAVRRLRDQADVAVRLAAGTGGRRGWPAGRPARPASRRWAAADTASYPVISASAVLQAG